MNQYKTTDERLDDLVDQRNISYSEAAERLGVTLPSAKSVSAETTEKRVADYTFYQHTSGVGEGLLSEEGRLRLYAGVQACRAAISKPEQV